MILEEMYSMREPFLRYTTEQQYDKDIHCVDIEFWKKENERLHLVHEPINKIDLWENIK